MRETMTRRRLLHRGAAVTGAVAATGVFGTMRALGANGGADPRPIPGGLDATFTPVTHDPMIHVLAPFVGGEMATITDFNGVVGAAHVQGTANAGGYNFDADMRFMQGTYVGVDGRVQRGTFGFI